MSSTYFTDSLGLLRAGQYSELLESGIWTWYWLLWAFKDSMCLILKVQFTLRSLILVKIKQSIRSKRHLVTGRWSERRLFLDSMSSPYYFWQHKRVGINHGGGIFHLSGQKQQLRPGLANLWTSRCFGLQLLQEIIVWLVSRGSSPLKFLLPKNWAQCLNTSSPQVMKPQVIIGQSLSTAWSSCYYGEKKNKENSHVLYATLSLLEKNGDIL